MRKTATTKAGGAGSTSSPAPADLVLPRIGTPRNPKRETWGGHAGAVARRIGKPLMPWQQHAADVALEIDPKTGGLFYKEVIITVPRQSGKTTLILVLFVLRCILFAKAFGPQTCTYIAQSGKMARRKLEREFAPILRRARTLAEVPQDSRARPKRQNEWKLSMNNNGEHIAFGTGSYLQIDPPTEDASHGDVLDMPVIDEAFSQGDDLVEQAVDAATITRASSQTYVISTVGNARSTFLAGKVTAGRKAAKQKKSRTCYLEWSVPDDADFRDPDVWAQYLPALGHTITKADLLARLDKAERGGREVDDGFGSGIDGFRRGYLNQWVDWPKAKGGDGPISTTRWSELTDGESMATDESLTLGVDAPMDRRSVCFSVSGRRPDGLRHGAIRYWVPTPDLGKVVEIGKMLAEGHGVPLHFPPKSPALAWRADFERAGVDVVEVKAAAFVEAQQTIEQAITDGTFRHRGQPEMVKAVEGLAARVAGDTAPWSRRSSSANTAPLFALAAALAGEGERTSTRSAYEDHDPMFV
ncbi:hypothetical protein H9L10_03585 [Phycicoccus endophyticus]|uniref:Terminase n=1 Tax=Phycicoccus endophyticus TaxID=1690220 RepID=A0A7G9R3H6_9MICO|nr:terminase family protein [Phycicoccus endophyticus]NHI19907.1 hypothetical protein [Phycicoccus endophyticus]QNN50151.1 hypothetical protein H9L10_03585 [Phycicoccus endophyticus]GGL27603.1 hypothetical protein GCM10012283_07260 [Phycicoccus endophyticus]